MKKFINVHSVESNNSFLINVDYIEAIASNNTHTIIYSKSNSVYRCVETYEEIVAKVAPIATIR